MTKVKDISTNACGVDPAAFMDDPNWADFLPDLVPGGDKCHLPSHEDCDPLDVESVARHLEPGGTLGRMKNYEARPGQLEMTRAVTRSYNDRTHLMVEAGTGVGKSLAYLIPSVHWSFVNDTPVILSTATRNLQSQLIATDLPRAAQTLGPDSHKLRATILKGRANYLCLRMMSEYMQGGYWTLSDEEKLPMNRLIEWIHQTKDGDLDTFGDDEMRPRLACASEDCAGQLCPYRQKCFVAKARARAMKSHVIIVNHALVLAEATNPGGGILPAYGRIVFDEAHNLEDIATNFFSFELSRNSLNQLLWRLARKTSTRRGHSRIRGILGAIERHLNQGAFSMKGHANTVRELITRAHVQISFVLNESDALFDLLKRLFSPAPSADVIRYRTLPGEMGMPAVRQYSLHGLFADYNASQWSEGDLAQYSARFENALARLQAILIELCTIIQDGNAHDNTLVFGDLAAQLQSISEMFRSYILESKFVLCANDPTRVYWVEKVRLSRRNVQRTEIRLVAAPLSVAKEMKQYFYDSKDSVILCSATLRAGDKFDYMARKLGVSMLEATRVKTLVAASPFDYFRQVEAMAVDFLPDPSTSQREYTETIAPIITSVATVMDGRTLVLFTAYEMMRNVAEKSKPYFDEMGIDLIVQGEGVSREAMVTELKKASRPVVLFGAQSFWEGVDVPGDALSCVIMARIPFPNAGEPIVEARCDHITEEGGKSFRDYMVPEAQLRFRQGFGRLVRTKRDTGVVIVTDSRIVQKNYGGLFRKSVPATFHTVSSIDEIVQRIKDADLM